MKIDADDAHTYTSKPDKIPNCGPSKKQWLFNVEEITFMKFFNHLTISFIAK